MTKAKSGLIKCCDQNIELDAWATSGKRLSGDRWRCPKCNRLYIFNVVQRNSKVGTCLEVGIYFAGEKIGYWLITTEFKKGRRGKIKNAKRKSG